MQCVHYKKKGFSPSSHAALPCFAHLFECGVHTKKCKAPAVAAMMLLQSNINLMTGAA